MTSVKPLVNPISVRLVGDGGGFAELDESRLGSIDCRDDFVELGLPTTDRSEVWYPALLRILRTVCGLEGPYPI
jgi:hypothetical protein